MGSKIKMAILIFLVYLLVFVVGFKSGTSYLRMQRKIQIEKIEVPAQPPPPPLYIIFEKRDYGAYAHEEITQVYEHDPIIKVLKNEKMRPLLKSRNMQIYTETGDRVY